MKFFALVLASALLTNVAQATCELTIDRKACPGKEEKALEPYDKKNPTTENTKAKDADACMKDAEKASKIIRKGTLASKTVTVKFDGKDLGKKEDAKPCN